MNSPAASPPTALEQAVRTALAQVKDPEIRRPITELNMVDTVTVDAAGRASIVVLITIAGCPMKDTIQRDVTAAASAVPGVTSVDLVLVPMTDAQREALRDQLRGPAKDIPFARPGSRTSVFAVASGKGGVGNRSSR